MDRLQVCSKGIWSDSGAKYPEFFQKYMLEKKNIVAKTLFEKSINCQGINRVKANGVMNSMTANRAGKIRFARRR